MLCFAAVSGRKRRSRFRGEFRFFLPQLDYSTSLEEKNFRFRKKSIYCVWEKNLAISSTCTVFAESEVISQLAMGTDKCDIINGIHKSVAHRVTGLAHRIGVVPDVVMTGGVAQNSGVVNALQQELGCEIHISPLTQYNGALGAALYAYQAATRQK